MTARALSENGRFRIGELAQRVGLSPDTLRFYERRGLLDPVARTASGYRLYGAAALERLTFIRKAQALGLTLDEVAETLRAAARGVRPCAHVRERLAARLRDVDARIAELESFRATLSRALARARSLPVARSCVCEIIESQEPPAAAAPSARRRRTPR